MGFEEIFAVSAIFFYVFKHIKKLPETKNTPYLCPEKINVFYTLYFL
ncbi:MAG: hypothetical protein LBE91_01865 [Tannerella sp.]|jgi:hypothetical protein|nr:hypothetical protein [Tannerella sp.]